MIESIYTIFMHMSQYKPFFGRYPLNMCICIAAVAFLLWTPSLVINRPASRSAARLQKALFAAGLFLLYLFWSLALPLYQTPDEQSHFAYVYHLAEFGSLPTAKGGRVNGMQPFIPAEYDRSLVFHRNIFDLMEKHAFSGGTRGIEEEAYSFPRAMRTQGHPATDDEWWKIQNNHYPPLYYTLAAGACQVTGNYSYFTRFWAARLVSLLLSLIAVLLAWRIACMVFPEDKDWRLRRAATLVFALFPMFCQVSISVNPNILEIVVFEACVLTVLRAWRAPMTIAQTLTLTALIAAGVLTRPQFAVLIPLAAAFIAYRAYADGARPGRAAALLLTLCAGCLCLAGWWFIWYYHVHGNLDFSSQVPGRLAESGFSQHPWTMREVLAAYPADITKTAQSFWGSFAWRNLQIPGAAAHLLSLVAIVGIILALTRKYRRPAAVRLALISAAYVALLCVTLCILGMQQRIMQGAWREVVYFPFHALVAGPVNIQGRNYFPALAGILLLAMYGWYAALPEKQRGKFLFLSVTAAAFFNLYSLFFLILPRFY